MEIIAYTTRGCKYCTYLEELFGRAKVDYKKIVVGNTANDFSMSAFTEDFPEVVGFPHVVIDGESIGGLVETAKFLMNLGLVSAPKK